MSENGVGCLVVMIVILVVAVAGMAIALKVNDEIWRTEAVKHGAAEYDSQTGAWRWKTKGGDDGETK